MTGICHFDTILDIPKKTSLNSLDVYETDKCIVDVLLSKPNTWMNLKDRYAFQTTNFIL